MLRRGTSRARRRVRVRREVRSLVSTRRLAVGRRPPLRRRREPVHDQPIARARARSLRSVQRQRPRDAKLDDRDREQGQSPRRGLGGRDGGRRSALPCRPRNARGDDGSAAAFRFRAGPRSSQGWPPRAIYRCVRRPRGSGLGHRSARRPPPAASAGSRQVVESVAGGSSLRPWPRRRRHPAARNRRRMPRASIPEAARAVRAGCRQPPRGSAPERTRRLVP